MNRLTVALADRKYNQTAKSLIILETLGKVATTAEVVAAGVSHGAKGIRGWNVGSLLTGAKGRVAKLPHGWQILPNAIDYLRGQGWVSETEEKGTIQSVREGQRNIFIGHGHSAAWRDLKDFICDDLNLKVLEFNSRSTAGLSNKERLIELLSKADFAFLVMTAEDELADGQTQARMNVIHEVGLFQGKLGFDKAIILLEEGCSEFSNMTGVGQIRFDRGGLMNRSEEIRRVLFREKILR